MDGEGAAPYQLSKLDVSNSVSSSEEEGCLSDSDDNEENAVETSMDYHDAREYPDPQMDQSTVDSTGEIASDGPENETDYYMDQDVDNPDYESEKHSSHNGMQEDYPPITVTQTSDGRTVSRSPRRGTNRLDNQVSDKGSSRMAESIFSPEPVRRTRPRDVSPDGPDPVRRTESQELSPDGSEPVRRTDSQEVTPKKQAKTHNRKSPAGKSMQDKLNLSFSKGGMHDDHLELDYEEDIETEVQKKGEGEEVMEKDDDNEEEGEIESEEEGEASSGDDDQPIDTDGEIVDDDCEEGEIKDREPSEPRIERDTDSPQPQQQLQQPPQPSYSRLPQGVCRFFVRGNCTWGNTCRFIHPGYDDKGPQGRMGGYQRNARPWAGRGVPEPDIPPPVRPAPAQESAWERGLRQAKELKLKAQKRKETDTDFEDKRKNLTIEEDKDFNKENERERTQTRDPYYDNIFEEDDYFDKQAQEAWHEGQYENFEVRWTREPPNFRYRDKPPAYRERFPEKEMYGPEKRFDKRKGEPIDGYKKSKEMNPNKSKGQDEWHDPWSRSNKTPPKKTSRRSASRSRSRGRRKHRSYSRGSHSSSGSSSSYTSRSRSRSRGSRASSYSSYSSRSSYSRSSSYSSRSSSRSNSRSRSPSSPHPKIRKTTTSANQNNKKPSKPASSAKVGELPRSTVSKLPPSHASQQGTLRNLLSQQRRNQDLQKAAAGPQRAPPGPQKGPQWPNKGMQQVIRRKKLGLPPLETNGARAPPYSAPPPMSKAAHLERLRNVADRGRLKPEQIPKRSKPGRTYSSSDSSRSRSRSSSSRSRSSSASSYSSTSSTTSSGSADSEHLYRKIRGRHSSATPPSPLINAKKAERAKDKTLGKELEKKKRELEKIKEQERIRELERAKELEMSKELDRVREAQKEVIRPKEKETKKVAAPTSRANATKAAQARPESRSRTADQRAGVDARLKSQVSTGRPASVTTVGTTKDPLKMTGQKSGIKLTLKSEKPAKKRSAPADVFAAPPKKAAKVAQPDSKAAKTDKPAKVAAAKAAPAKSKTDLPKSPVKAAPKAAAPVAPPVLKKKSSTSSRREELLKQLKAVEDAILRKRSKIT